MTPRRVANVSVPRGRARDYARTGEGFWNGAEVAREYEYFNAAGVLLVHAAIAYADAVAIREMGVKSRAEGHIGAADLLRGLSAGGEPIRNAVHHLEKVIEAKNRVSYEGEDFRRADLETLHKHAERFRDWARRRLGT